MKYILKARRILTFIMLPIVILGMYFVYQKTRSNEIYAIDPLVVTYNGDTPSSPLFTLDDMKPGDVYERCINIKNNSIDCLEVEMDFIKILESLDFTGVLNIYVYDSSTLEKIYEGTVDGIFSEDDLNLGIFEPGSEKNICFKVSFPWDAGNEYQNAKAVFDINWETDPCEEDGDCSCEDSFFSFLLKLFNIDFSCNLFYCCDCCSDTSFCD